MSSTIKLKGCSRCGGDLSMERDTYGTYAMCLQCGATHEQPAHQEVRMKPIWSEELVAHQSP